MYTYIVSYVCVCVCQSVFVSVAAHCLDRDASKQ